ncbi:hypothetical protein AAF49_001081 [Escherichia coli]|nr:hypothetical protein [Escherichia coli]
MNSEGGKPGNVLTVNGNYTGNNGLMTFMDQQQQSLRREDEWSNRRP